MCNMELTIRDGEISISPSHTSYSCNYVHFFSCQRDCFRERGKKGEGGNDRSRLHCIYLPLNWHHKYNSNTNIYISAKLLSDDREQLITKEVMPQFWQVIAGLSPWKPKFNPRLVDVRFVVTFQILEHELTMESIRLYSQSCTMQLDSLLVHNVQLFPTCHLCCSSWFS